MRLNNTQNLNYVLVYCFLKERAKSILKTKLQQRELLKTKLSNRLNLRKIALNTLLSNISVRGKQRIK